MENDLKIFTQAIKKLFMHKYSVKIQPLALMKDVSDDMHGYNRGVRVGPAGPAFAGSIISRAQQNLVK